MDLQYFNKYHQLGIGKYLLPDAAHISSNDTMLVDMYNSGITCSKSRIPCIGTAALYTCTGIGLFNRKTKVAGVIHSPMWEKEDFKKLLSKVRTNDKDLIECHIIGAIDEPEDLDSTKDMHKRLDALCQTIETTPNVAIKTFDVADKLHPSAFIIDSRNGRLIRGTELVTPGISDEEDFVLDYEIAKSNFFDGTASQYLKQGRKFR